MDMDAYLVEIEFSASGLIDLIWGEHKRIEVLKVEIDKSMHVVEDNYRRAEFIQQFGDDIDDVMLGVGMQFENYFGDHKNHHAKNQNLLASEALWESRNQTMHWEEGNLRAAPEAAFQTLIADFGVKFNEYLVRDMAFEVVELLGWTSFAAFEIDMLTLQ